jgi:hypothetical protein
MDGLKQIRIEPEPGKKIDRVRDVERLWLEVEAVGGGSRVEGHRVLGVKRNDDGTFSGQPTRIEIYIDRLGAVLSRTRTDKERRVHEMAVMACDEQRKQWMEENKAAISAKRSKEERDRWIDINCMFRPELEYPRLGYRTGLPPLESCKVLHPQTGDSMDAFEWRKLPAEQRREWLVDAPKTADNANSRSADALAQAIAKAFANQNQAPQERTQQNKQK